MIRLLTICSALLIVSHARLIIKRDVEGTTEPIIVAENVTASAPTQPMMTECKCEPRYFQHYIARNCEPVYEGDCNCPIHFKCPEEIQTGTNSTCIFRGETYQIGDDVKNFDPCKRCSCRRGLDVPTITCAYVECPQLFLPPLSKDCYSVYDKERCCPVSTVCANETTGTSPKTCMMDGKEYQLGQKMYPANDECKICLCTEDFDPATQSTCKQADCAIDLRIEEIKRGCIPIYHEKTCCPIEYHCPKQDVQPYMSEVDIAEKPLPEICQHPSEIGTCYALFTRYFYNTSSQKCEEFSYGGCRGNENNFETVDECQSACEQRKGRASPPMDLEKMCKYDSNNYPIGFNLDIKHPTNCVECNCSTPPTFTCVHKSCPTPSSDRNCTANYATGECCPKYTCDDEMSK